MYWSLIRLNGKIIGFEMNNVHLDQITAEMQPVKFHTHAHISVQASSLSVHMGADVGGFWLRATATSYVDSHLSGQPASRIGTDMLSLCEYFNIHKRRQ